jgi:transcription elongation factor GreB
MKGKEVNYITPKGFQALSEELSYLLKTERPELTKVVSWAASLGDRSENADYIYGKKKLREIDKRIRFLQTRVNLALIVDPEKINSLTVQFGATVTLTDDEEVEYNFSIVGVDEINTAKGHISYRSPIGASLIGKSVGDSVLIHTPKKEIEYEIVKVFYRNIHED